MAKKRVTAVAGTQWGDEGKGRVVDDLSEEIDLVVRPEGGANAGHTVWIGSRKFVGHLLPCGAASGKTCVLGRGVRIDLKQLSAEIAELKKLCNETGSVLPPIFVDAGAFLSLPWHATLEAWVESQKSAAGSPVGSTLRGIGPIAATNALRVNVQVSLVFHPNELLQQLRVFYNTFSPIFKEWKSSVPAPEAVAADLMRHCEWLQPYVCDTRALLYEAWQDGQAILVEGAHGLGLDPHWGTYGYNTAGMCTFAGLFQGCGLPITAANGGRLIGVVKAYATRVGNGPFPSELDFPELLLHEQRIPDDQLLAWLLERREMINAGRADSREIGEYFRRIGREYGATTGRPRRCGWLDLAWLAYSTRVLGCTELALTKLDCLSGLRELQVVVGYRLDGQPVPLGRVPSLTRDFARLEPEVRTMTGWTEDIRGVTEWDNLPHQAQQFVRCVAEFVGVPITFIGTGPERGHLIRRQAP